MQTRVLVLLVMMAITVTMVTSRRGWTTPSPTPVTRPVTDGRFRKGSPFTPGSGVPRLTKKLKWSRDGGLAAARPGVTPSSRAPVYNPCDGSIVQVDLNSGEMAPAQWPYPYEAGTCMWNITVNENEMVELQFDYFNIGCNRGDWMSIEDESGTFYLDRYCGRHNPENLVVVAQHLLVTFYARRDNRRKRGFHALFEVVEAPEPGSDPCMPGGMILTANTTVQSTASPGFQTDLLGSYDNDMDCMWTIAVPVGYTVIVQFVSFDVEYDEDCGFDVVTLSDEQGPIVNLCGTGSVPAVKTESPSLVINFITDYSETLNGFNFTFVAVEAGLENDGSEPGCGDVTHEVNTPGAVITSPNSPSAYPSLSECSYHVTAPEGTNINIQFTEFDLENGISCRYDSLTIYDGGSTLADMLVDPLCGSTIPILPTSSSNELFFVFESDASREMTGFSFSWTAVVNLDPCVSGGVTLTTDTGVVQSPNFGAGQYGNNEVCSWTILADEGEQISLEWTAFDVEAHTSCGWDKVAVYDGADSSAALIGAFCGSAPPATEKSSGAALHIVFDSDYSVTAQGFSANYRMLEAAITTPTTDPACDGSATALTGDSGTFSSPDYDGTTDYPPSAACAWTITVPDDKQIKITFLTVDMEDTTSCRTDAIRIYTGTDDSGPAGNTLCGDLEGVDKVVRSHEAYVTFTTDATVQGAGFDATWEAIDVVESSCGIPEHDIKSKAETNQRIIGGAEINTHSLPWQIMLLRYGSFICGGSVISPNWVLTAAHCTYGGSASNYRICAGKHSRSLGESTEQCSDVVELIVHEGYSPNTLNRDVALLRLASPLELNDKVQPICVGTVPPTIGDDDNCLTSGWGTMDNGNLASNLQQVYLPIVGHDACIGMNGNGITQYMICAGRTEGGIDACQGDSGGPLVCINDATNSWELHGVTSWGYGCAEPNYPGVWARVASLVDWIQTNTNNDPEITYN